MEADGGGVEGGGDGRRKGERPWGGGGDGEDSEREVRGERGSDITPIAV